MFWVCLLTFRLEFVAMPLGKGYIAEGQLTGVEVRLLLLF